jgi:hypothetical protein
VFVLGPGLGRPDPGPDAGPGTEATEQAELRLLEDLELGVAIVHAQLVERSLLGLLDRASGGLYPLHGSYRPLRVRR